MNPGNQSCASCHYWHHAGANAAWCDAAQGYTDPVFHCQDWRDLRDRTDPMTGGKWGALGPAPIDVEAAKKFEEF